jgi:hypothetical protein
MSIESRLNLLEARSNTNQSFTPSQLKYLKLMIDGSGCNKTIEELDGGRNLSIISLILVAYGLDPDDNKITDVPSLEEVKI